LQSHDALQVPLVQSVPRVQGFPTGRVVQKPPVQVPLAQSLPVEQWNAGAALHVPVASAVVQS